MGLLEQLIENVAGGEKTVDAERLETRTGLMAEIPREGTLLAVRAANFGQKIKDKKTIFWIVDTTTMV